MLLLLHLLIRPFLLWPLPASRPSLKPVFDPLFTRSLVVFPRAAATAAETAVPPKDHKDDQEHEDTENDGDNHCLFGSRGLTVRVVVAAGRSGNGAGNDGGDRFHEGWHG